MIGMPPAPGMAFIITRHVPPDCDTIPDAAPECAEMGPEACLGLQLDGYQGWVSMNTGSAFSLFLPLRAAGLAEHSPGPGSARLKRCRDFPIGFNAKRVFVAPGGRTFQENWS